MHFFDWTLNEGLVSQSRIKFGQRLCFILLFKHGKRGLILELKLCIADMYSVCFLNLYPMYNCLNIVDCRN
jgi:hypothetical protein